MKRKRDPGPCPVDDTPHTACCAPGPGTGTGIVAGAIVPATSVTVTGPTSASAAASPPNQVMPEAAPSASTFSTATYRGRRSSPPPDGGK